MHLRLFVAFWLALTFNFSLRAAPSDLDTSFATSGKLGITFTGTSAIANAIAVQADGNIVLAGTDGADFALARFAVKTNTLDTNFGNAGRVVTSINSGKDVIYGMVLQTDGKIVVAGETPGTTADTVVARYLSSGALDTTFGTGGKVVLNPLNDADGARGVALQSDGKIVVTGYSTRGGIIIMRLTTSGALDTTFSGDGIVTALPDTGAIGNAIAVQADGKIVITGAVNGDIVVARYTTSGASDGTFNGTGGLLYDVAAKQSTDTGNAIAFQGNNIIIAGRTSNGSGPAGMALIRVLPNGTVDSTFNGGVGYLVALLSTSDSSAAGVQVQSNNRIVAAGTTGSDFGLIRCEATGVLDATFGTSGKLVTDINASVDIGRAVLVQNDGRIVAAGSAVITGKTTGFAAARYLGDVAPSVSSTAATGITTTGATLNANVTPNGQATTAYFEYSTDAALAGALSTTVTSIGSGSTSVQTSAAISGLTPSTTYYFRIVATNPTGTRFGSILSFTTTGRTPGTTTSAATAITSTTAALHGSVIPYGQATNGHFEYATNSALTSPTSTADVALGTGQTAAALDQTVSGLLPNTMYYFRAVATNATGTSTGAIFSFSTATAAPSATTLAASGITGSTATLNATVTPRGQATTGRFDYGTSPTLTGASTTTSVSLGSGQAGVPLNTSVAGLLPNTTYYFRAVATNATGTTTAGILSFTTAAVAPTVTSSAATLITSTTATLTGTANPNGQSTTGRFDYGTSPTLTGATSTTAVSLGSGQAATPLSQGITGLLPNTTYYYRASATNGTGTTSGSILSFTTATAAPSITTLTPDTITPTSAALHGSVNPNNQASTGFFKYSTDATLEPAFSTVSSSMGSGSTAVPLNFTLTGLLPSTTYYVRAAGTNATGTGQGAILSFTTLGAPPSVTTLAATAVVANGAQLHGSINPQGQDTSAFFQYGTSPSLAGASSTSSVQIGIAQTAQPLDQTLSGLPPATTYYYRAVATNATGTSAGSIRSFTTGAVAPTVTTTTANNLSATGANLRGSVNPNGTTTTARFEYGTDSALVNALTTADLSAGSGTSPSALNQTITGLAPNTTYYYRATADNGGGSGTGSIVSFVTPAAPPSVTTDAATGVTAAAASLHAQVNPNGQATTGQFSYSTASDLSGAQTTTSVSLGSGQTATPLDQPISGLLPATTYFYRASASNVSGPTNGGILSFTTAGVEPTVTTGTATGTTASTSTLVGTVTPNGQTTSGHFEYSTDSGLSSPTSTSDQNLGSGQTGTNLSQTLTGLLPNTVYYYRAVATNATGATFGSISSVRTLTTPPTVSTDGATGTGGTILDLAGSVNPNGQSTTAHFDYDTDPALTSAISTADVDLGAGQAPATLSQTLSGLLPNTTYYFRAVATNSTGTTTGNLLSVSTGLIAPSVVTLAATGITTSEAALHGTADPNGLASTGGFEYGTDPSLASASTTSTASLGSGQTDVTIDQTVTGLAPNTTYYYRTTATNSAGSAAGPILSFTTASLPPDVTTLPASNTSLFSATIGGQIDPQQQTTLAHFEYGTDSTLSTATATADVSLSAGPASQVTADLSGLSQNTTYYYRLVASNAGGTTNGSILSLRTVNPLPEAVLSSDSPVPGEPTGTIFVSFGPGVIDGGNVGTTAQIRRPDGTVATLVLNATTNTVIARGAETEDTGNVFTSFGDPLFAGESYAFSAGIRIATPSQIPSLRLDRSLQFGMETRNIAAGIGSRVSALYSQLSQAAGRKQIAAQTGTTSGISAARYARFGKLGMARSNGALFFAAVLQQSAGITSGNNFGIWRQRSDGSGNSLLIRTGASVNTVGGGQRTLRSVSSWPAIPGALDQRVSFAADGGLAVRATFLRTASAARDSAPDATEGIVKADADGNVQVEVDTATPVPSENGAAEPSFQFTAFTPPATASRGFLAFTAALKAIGTGGVAPPPQALFAARGGAMRRVLARGDAVPGIADARFARLGAAMMGESGMIGLIASMTGTSVKPSTAKVIMTIDEGDEKRVVARQGDQAPGMEAGVTFRRFGSTVVTDSDPGRSVFTAVVGGPGVTAKNNVGIWSKSLKGPTYLLLRKGDTITVGGKSVTVRVIRALLPPAKSQGQGRSTDAAGFLTTNATLTDGRTGILRIQLP